MFPLFLGGRSLACRCGLQSVTRRPHCTPPSQSTSATTHEPTLFSAKQSNEESSIRMLMQLFDLRTPADVRQLLGADDAKYVLTHHADDLRHSYDQLLQLGLPANEIRHKPKVLAKNALTIQNHYHVLQEIAFRPIGVGALVKYVSITNKSVDRLKELDFVDADVNMPQRLADRLRVDLDPQRAYATDGRVRDLRRAVLNTFLRAEFDMSAGEQDRIWSTYTNLRHKAFGSIFEAVEVCRDLLGMSTERIKQHPYVLYADPANVRQIVAQGTLGGIDARQLLWRRPKIMMTNCRNLLRAQQVIRDFGVPDTAFPRCVEIFTLGPDTIYERLCDLRKIREFDVLVNHPRVLRLVHYQMKARARLEYLRKMKVNCVSLHVLSSGSVSFERYARTGVDRTKGVDILMLLRQRLGGAEATEIRARLNRHPNWCHVPAVSVKQVLDWLESVGFSVECIYANVHVLLYPLKRIEHQFEVLKDSQARWGVAPESLTDMQRLQMCVYLIELEFHFEGDGIWLEPLNEASGPGGAPVVGETEFDMLGDYRKTLGPIELNMEALQKPSGSRLSLA